jgi:hypothetical protein
MVTVLDWALADTSSTGMLYAPDETGPRAVQVVISTSGSMRAKRVSGDYTAAYMYGGESGDVLPVGGQLLNLPTGWYIILRVDRESPFGRAVYPTRLMLEHLSDTLSGLRPTPGGDPLPVQVRVTFETPSITIRSDGSVDQRTPAMCPMGADVQIGDYLTYDGWTWRVYSKLPLALDGLNVARQLNLQAQSPLSAEDGGTEGDFPMMANAHVKATHQDGTVVYTDRYVRLSFPSIETRAAAAGAGVDVPVELYDVDGATYTIDDIVTITSMDNYTRLPSVTSFIAGTVENTGVEPFEVRVQLTGQEQGR